MKRLRFIMPMRRPIGARLFLIILLSALVFGPALKGSNPSANGQQGPFDFMTTLDYPDQQWIRPVYGRIDVVLTAAGSKKKDGSTTEANVTARGSMIFDKNGATFMSESTGLITDTTPADPNDECKKAQVWSSRWSGGKNYTRTGSDGMFGITVSKQKGLAHFAASHVFDLSGVVAKSDIARCTTQNLPDGDVTIVYRSPLHGSGGTPFSGVAAKIEAEGKYLNAPLQPSQDHNGEIGGEVESYWDGSGTSGTFSTPVLALAGVASPVVIWNTIPAWQANPNGADSDQLFPGTLQVTWSFSVQPENADIDLILDPQGYEDWTPKGGTDEKTVGDSIPIKATVRSKDGKPPKRLPSMIVFELSGVSQEAGVDLNLPVDKKGSDDPDLQFDPAKNKDLSVTGDKQQRAEYSGGGATVTAQVSSYDWAAYGTLKVTAIMSDGKKIQGHLKTSSGPTEVLLPKRGADSKIADKWKADHHVSSQTDDDDGDRQDGNNNEGDGLTLYEEYRGVETKNGHRQSGDLEVKGRHVRLDPGKKDLIVENKAGDLVRGGFQLFEDQSGINVIELAAGQLPDDRVVNAHSSVRKGLQHGVRLELREVSGRGGSSDMLGKALDVSGSNGVVPRSPGSCLIVKINNKIAELAASEGPTFVDWAIAHELAHACGVQHHGPPTTIHSYPGELYADATYTIFGENDLPVPQRPFEIKGDVGVPGNESSGDVNCIMTYNLFYDWALPLGQGTKTYISVGTRGLNRYGKIFCRSKIGTEWNASGHHPHPLFGNAGAGNCMSQLRVRDW